MIGFRNLSRWYWPLLVVALVFAAVSWLSPLPAQEGQRSGSDAGKNKGARPIAPPCLSWINHEIEPTAVLLCVHGLGLHNGTYESFGKALSSQGIPTYAIDVRGFGSWMDAAGHQRVDFKGCLEDMRLTLKAIRKAHPGVKVFVLGESMGGAIALQAAVLYPDLVDGVISAVPSGDRFHKRRTALKVAVHLLDPNKPFDIGSQVVAQATDKPELRRQWSSDPLARLKLSAKELLQFDHFMNQTGKLVRRLKDKPVLIVQGCKDNLVKPGGTVEIYNELATPDRQLVLIPSAEHLIFEEGQFRDWDVNLVKEWIKRHTSPEEEDMPAPPTAGAGDG